jgi:putative peptidoglycan lipid II flippase
MISLLNILNFVSIFLSVIFQILLIKSFGANLQTDAYYLTIGITQFVNAIFLGITTDLFIPVYNEVKIKGKEESLKFTGAVFLLILFIGSFLAVIVYLIAPILVKIFATGFTEEKVIFSANLIKILSITIVFSALNGLMIAALNANLFMMATYAAALTIPTLNNIALIFFSKTHGVNAIAFSIVLGSIWNFFFLFFYHFKRVGWALSNPYGNPDILCLIKKNFVIRSAHFINSLKAPLTTNVLSYFPLGYLTLFSYTDKILNILFKITNSPMLNILFVKASNFLVKNKFEEIKIALKSTLKGNLLLFICMLIPTMILFKKLFGVVFVNKLSSDEINIMYSLFLCLIPYYLTLSLELPYTNITIAMKKGTKIAEIAGISLLLYGLFLLFSMKLLMIYTIPIAISCAQIYNTVAYTKYVNNRLGICDEEIVKAVVLYVVLGIILVSLNYFLKNNFIIQLYANLLVIGAWLILVGKDIILVFRLVTRKGEIK